MRIARARSAVWVTAAALVLATVGCADEQPDQRMSDADAVSLVFDTLASSDDAVSGIYLAENLADYLPSQHVVIDGAAPAPLASGVVYGTVEDARPLSGSVLATLPDGEGDPDGASAAFYDPDADWRTAAVSVNVERSWGPALPQAGAVEFVVPVAMSVDADAFMRGLEALDNILVVLDSTYSEDESLYRVAVYDTAIGVVDEAGSIAFPAMGDEAPAFIGRVESLEALDARAKHPQPHIVVEQFEVVSR